jgi:hypothetical protein
MRGMSNSTALVTGATGGIGLHINNAGISLDTGARVTETDVEVFRRTYETNVFGVVAVTNAFLPALRRSAHPRIVNISSGTGSLTWSTGPNPQFDYQAAGTGSGAAYRSSKTALDALTVFYAHALARDGFKVNALRPGCGPRISTPEPPAPAATQLTQRPAQSGSHCCPTTAPLASFSPGTGRSCRGERRCRLQAHTAVGVRLPDSRHRTPDCRRDAQHTMTTFVLTARSTRTIASTRRTRRTARSEWRRGGGACAVERALAARSLLFTSPAAEGEMRSFGEERVSRQICSCVGAKAGASQRAGVRPRPVDDE